MVWESTNSTHIHPTRKRRTSSSKRRGPVSEAPSVHPSSTLLAARNGKAVAVVQRVEDVLVQRRGRPGGSARRRIAVIAEERDGVRDQRVDRDRAAIDPCNAGPAAHPVVGDVENRSSELS